MTNGCSRERRSCWMAGRCLYTERRTWWGLLEVIAQTKDYNVDNFYKQFLLCLCLTQNGAIKTMTWTWNLDVYSTKLQLLRMAFIRIKYTFNSHDTRILSVKFQVCLYGGTLVAITSPGLRLIFVDVALKAVLHVNVTALSLERNCVISHDVVDVHVLASMTLASIVCPPVLVHSMTGMESSFRCS